MAKHNFIGSLGELLAIQFLQVKGYRILEKNWRYARAEIDVIAQLGDLLVFVEVKTRSSDYWAHPAAYLGEPQQNRIMDVAGIYIDEQNYEGAVRFDVISVLLPKNDIIIEHFEDAFY